MAEGVLEEYSSKLWSWVHERQVAPDRTAAYPPASFGHHLPHTWQVVAVHAWSCALRINLTLRAHASAADFVAATPPISSQLLVGLDLDPASTDDFRHVASHTLAPDGYVVGGIQMTESPPEGVDAGEPSANHAHHAHHAHVKGNAYNFASSPQHASSFALVQGQLAGVPCFRTRRGVPLGCVEVAFNWCAPFLYSHMATTL